MQRKRRQQSPRDEESGGGVKKFYDSLHGGEREGRREKMETARGMSEASPA